MTSLIFENALWILYLTKLGYSLSMIAIIQIFFSVSLLCFEYLSGILADKFGRKKMLVIANFCICIYALAMVFAHKLFIIFIAYFIYAFGMALISGTSESFLYDNLDFSDQKHFIKFSSIMQATAIISTFFADSVSGQIVTYVNWYAIYLMTLASHVFAILILFFIKDNYQEQIVEGENKIYKNLNKEFKFKKELYFLLIVFAFLQSSVSIMFIYSQTIFENLSLLPSGVSLIYAVTSLVSAAILFLMTLIKKLN